ncbi:Crp/Fnr family transcriptional regulator [Pelagibacterium flavum]|uniref:Crp/Fnr family transcriptional regulator n=1 Tax=Pelagibacterium flavum TaxID=2984530 RepID=A0ABY6IKR4_9HYPH|nr:Crp/Fnr family transcriptional regulator [Pelagibacterium sp. YIM 151497]UYQ71181.1 Crp/Fnr family transcriptional regulator [Pelagibacterium sp. YIM 151497]
MSLLSREQMRQFSLFERLSEEAFDEILSAASARNYSTGRSVFEQGGEAREFYVLVQGKLKVSQVTEDGQQVIIRIVVPGDLFGIARALQRVDYPGTATAVVDSSVLAWPMSYWDRFVEKDAALAVSAMQTVGQRLQESHARLREMATEEVERRVAHTVLRLIEQSGKPESGGIRIDFPISKQDLAEMSGTTLHTVSRIMSGWQERGLVSTGRQKLLVCDHDRLLDLAESGPER